MEEAPKHVPMEDMEVFRRFVEVADGIWEEVSKWSALAVDTVGKQLIRATDSIGANLVKGDGRHSDAEASHFFVIARASARESRYWLQRASKRRILSTEVATEYIERITSATQLLNRLIRYRRNQTGAKQVREATEPYMIGEPFKPDESGTPERLNA